MLKKKDVEIFDEIISVFPEKIKNKLYLVPNEIKASAREIRVNRKIRVIYSVGSFWLDIEVSPRDINEIFGKMCGYSVYSFEEQIKNGFLTFKGGHRIGIASSAVIESGQIRGIKDITSLNLRIAREFKGCSDYLYSLIKDDFSGVLIVGSPSSGKTTLLRDLARNFSKDKKVSIVDERFEIASSSEGILQMDVGNSDVLSGFPKCEGILRAVRCLSAEIVICDEIGSLSEAKSINQALNSGVRIIASIHAKDEKEILKKSQALSLVNSGAFGKIVILDSLSVGKISKILKTDEVF